MLMFYFGVDYYPEQWPEERWSEDARLMAEAGFNCVRLAEFAWSKLEEREGCYDFTWLDRAMTILHDRGIRVLLGTPTASPPAWLVNQHPEILRVREDGHRVTFGNRREYCPNNPIYRDYACRIVTRLAEHYADHPAVMGWQIDNEFGDRCYCPVCSQAFQNWLSRRHGSLENLNTRWGTEFWSHHYGAWQEIPTPLATGSAPNPGLALDYARFASDSYVGFQQTQIDILRERCPGHILVHDLMGFKFDQINYFDLALPLDTVAWNNYPRTQWNMQAAVDPSYAALAHDTMRGLKHKNYWVTEQQAGSGGWDIVSVPPRPGECRLWAFQSIAHGADAILFFRWRTARFGTEQYWHGLLNHDASPSRRYEEIKRMGAEMRRIGGEVVGSAVKPSVAMLLSYDSRFAFQIQPNNPLFSYPEHFHQFYRALHQRHVAIDIAAPHDDLTGYKLVVAPALHVISPAIAENLKRCVEAGGVLVLTQRSAVKDESNAVFDRPLPGLLDELCGVQVEEYDSLPRGAENPLEFSLPVMANSHPPSASVWCDILKPMGATVVARYTKDYYAGKPAITVNSFGTGKAVYVGAAGDSALYETLADWLLELSSVPRLLAAPPGIEVTERWQGRRRILLVLNHTERQQQITLDCCYRNLLDDSAPLEGTVAVPPREVLVLLENKNES
jgi:beta-galactosidase